MIVPLILIVGDIEGELLGYSEYCGNSYFSLFVAFSL